MAVRQHNAVSYPLKTECSHEKQEGADELGGPEPGALHPSAEGKDIGSCGPQQSSIHREARERTLF